MTNSDTYDPADGVAIIGWRVGFPERECRGVLAEPVAGVETISFFTERNWTCPAPSAASEQDPPTCARAAYWKTPTCSTRLLQHHAREAEMIDPQQRVFLETAWEALEDAGYDPQAFPGPIGVFAGMSNNTYFLANLQSRRDVTECDSVRSSP